MKKLLFLAVFATAVGFTSGNAAIQKGADCDALFDSTNQLLKDAGFSYEGAFNGAADVFSACMNTGGHSGRILDL